jgi:N-acetylmuramoyl-L-alanine amidase
MVRALLPALLLPLGLQAQESLEVARSSGREFPAVEVTSHNGFAAFDAGALTDLGWLLEDTPDGIRATFLPGGPAVEIEAGSPYLRWGEEEVHLAQVPYRASGRFYLPVQFLVDILPWKLPEEFRYQTGSWLLEVLDAEAGGDLTRVVVIDAGHGGRDPGTVGPGGTREKEIVLGVARALARILEEEPNLDVHLTRDSDVLVPIWQRGELATEWKGNRHGVFISIHANALPGSSGTRGFETYFLSEARTEHERRVAALENSAVQFEREGDGRLESDPDLTFILTELRNLDHAHWSALLAEIIQEKMDPVHPGPNRGVKQAPLAVITNSLMPAVLLELGFLSNREEERLLGQDSFQEELAASVGQAVLEFFRRYPPGDEWVGGGAG